MQTEVISQADEIVAQHPAKVFDLSEWEITLPMDANGDAKVD